MAPDCDPDATLFCRFFQWIPFVLVASCQKASVMSAWHKSKDRKIECRETDKGIGNGFKDRDSTKEVADQIKIEGDKAPIESADNHERERERI